MDQGNVAERGSHKELVGKKGAYARLWNAQQELEHYTKGGDGK